MRIVRVPSIPPSRYDDGTIFLHWLTAGLVTVLWCLGQTIDLFPKEFRIYARSTHIALGVALAITLAARIYWRFVGGGIHLPQAGLGWLDKVATFTHWLLYGLLVVTVILGITNAWERGDSIFNLFKLHPFAPGNKDLRSMIEDYHADAANALAAVAVFHATAGLLHQFVWKDRVLKRMLPVR